MIWLISPQSKTRTISTRIIRFLIQLFWPNRIILLSIQLHRTYLSTRTLQGFSLDQTRTVFLTPAICYLTDFHDEMELHVKIRTRITQIPRATRLTLRSRLIRGYSSSLILKRWNWRRYAQLQLLTFSPWPSVRRPNRKIVWSLRLLLPIGGCIKQKKVSGLLKTLRQKYLLMENNLLVTIEVLLKCINPRFIFCCQAFEMDYFASPSTYEVSVIKSYSIDEDRCFKY